MDEFKGLTDQALSDLFNESAEILTRVHNQLAVLNRQHDVTLARRLRLGAEIERRARVPVA